MLVTLIIVGVIILWGVGTYNMFIRLTNRVAESWADIDVQLKRRFDLIPNILGTVKGYAKHEEGVFTKVTEARTALMNAEQSGDVKGMASADNMLTGAMKSLFAVAEAYPELKANENFLDLQRELSDTENKIQAARRFYNSVVRDMNIKVESVPSSIIAGLFKFKKQDFYDLEGSEAERENIKVDFSEKTNETERV